MNSNFIIEAVPKDEDDDYVQQFSTRLKSMMIFLVVLICVVTPYALNFEYTRAENSEQNLEDFLKIVDQVIMPMCVSHDVNHLLNQNVWSSLFISLLLQTMQDIIGKNILGASLEERVGHLDVPKNCAIFYADDPGVCLFVVVHHFVVKFSRYLN